MLDTIVLMLLPHEFTLLDYEAFTPSAALVLGRSNVGAKRGGIACVCNPTKQLKARFGYLPRLTLSKRPAVAGFRIALRIEFSAPKLLYGNNFDELTNTDFSAICYKLQEQLHHMKVKVSLSAIKNASISAIHYSKNLPLTDHTSCSMVIREIAKGSVTRQLDTVKTDYQNDGSAIRFHASNHEIIVYDKLKDLARGKKSDKRAIEDESDTQLSLLHTDFQKPFDVARLEIRLGNRQKIKAVLAKLQQHRDLTFAALFDENLAKLILLDFWYRITPDMPIIIASQFNSGELYDTIHKTHPTMKPTKILQLLGAFAMIRTEGLDGVRVRIEQHCTTRAWYELRKTLNDSNITTKMKFNALQVAEKHLCDFEALRLEDYRV